MALLRYVDDMDPRLKIFEAARAAKGAGFTADQVAMMNHAFDNAGIPKDISMDLTPRAVCFVASKEGLVQEAYKDSVGVWTWALGVTNASGHEVYPRYKDKPQDIQKCVDVSVWLMRNTYLPPVLKAFSGYALKEHELAAALSWHWNTGRILSTDWVGMVKAGKRSEARKFMEEHYLNSGTLTGRRKLEAALFFDAKWPSSLQVPVYPVAKPSYSPAWGKAKLMDLTEAATKALAA